MNKCPSDFDLALLAEGKLAEAQALEICAHARGCPECAHILADMGEIQTLSDVGLLHPPNTLEIEQAQAALKHLLPDLAPHAPHIDEASAPQKTSMLERLDDYFFAGLLTGGGASSLYPPPSGAPAFGNEQNKNVNFFERNVSPDASIPNEHANAALGSSERQNMMEDKMRMNTAIAEVFNQPLDGNQIGLDGAPGVVSPDIQQGYTNTCAVRCQEIILRDYGIEVPETELRDLAARHGWYDPEFGTFADDVSQLLSAHGISVRTYENATIFHLTHELARGNRAMVAVDSGEMWSRNSIYGQWKEAFEDHYLGEMPDHVVLVSGVDMSDPNAPMVIVTDPGTGEVAAEYPLEQFLGAWEDSGFHMVATTTPPEQFGLAHVHTIGEIPYEQFDAWYPSVEHLTGAEAFFNNLCNTFDHLLTGYDAAANLNLFDPAASDDFVGLANELVHTDWFTDIGGEDLPGSDGDDVIV